MKKIIVLLLVSILIISFAGCTNNDEIIPPDDGEEQEQTQGEQDNETDAANDTEDIQIVNGVFQGLDNNDQTIVIEVDGSTEKYNVKDEDVEKFAVMKKGSILELEVKNFDNPSTNEIVNFEVLEENGEAEAYEIIGVQYVGLIDPHTAEFISVAFENQAKAYQIDEKIAKRLEDFNEGDLVNLYISQEDADKIIRVEEVPFLNTKGEYIGLHDPHTVELKVNNRFISFQIADDMQEQFESIPERAEVLFNYKYENKNFHITEILEWNYSEGK